MLLEKLSRNYVEMSSRILLKEGECASIVVGDICQILRSKINRSICTLNDAFYYKIKSGVLIGTPLTSTKRH